MERQMVIQAYKKILEAQEPMRRYAEFRYYFADEKDTSIPVPLGGGTLQDLPESALPWFISEHIYSSRSQLHHGIGYIYGHRDSQGSWSGPDHRL